MYGIPAKSFQLILDAFSGFEEIEKAGIYGSRALGNFRNGSDVDVVVYGEKISDETLLKLKVKLEHELPLPFYFDLTHYETIQNPELKEHIDMFAQIIYPL
jgi:uncharacterized protein